MLVVINATGQVVTVVNTADEQRNPPVVPPGFQLVTLQFDVNPSKFIPYTAPITHAVEQLLNYDYEEELLNGQPLLDARGQPLKHLITKDLVTNTTLLDKPQLFTIDDVLKLKYTMLAANNFFPNVYWQQFYTQHLNGVYDSGPISLTPNTMVLLHAIGSFKQVELSNDGGNTLVNAISNVPTYFPSNGTGVYRVIFDIAPLEYGILYV